MTIGAVIMGRSLDIVVTSVATQLMSADAGNSQQISRQILGELVEHFGVDFSFLRHNDHRIRASRLIAEWPPRTDIPDPDPLAVVYFADADPVFALSENSKVPRVFRPEPATGDYQRLIEEGRGIPATSMAAAPLIAGDVTTGVLGFVKLGDREWTPEELNALEAIGSLFAQLQARIAAEEQLRYLAEHDDLTGVYNRRALVAHLDDRLSARRAGPVAVLFFDLDRLKAVNDYLGHNAGDWFIRVFAERLCDKAGERCMIARLGGDEFVAVPAGRCDAKTAEELAYRFQNALHERVSVDGEMLTRTVSVGVAVGSPGRDTSSDLLRRADHAVLSAKSSGGNQVAVFSGDDSLNNRLRNDIELHLQGVIGSDALVLHYLPEIDMRTGDVLATEALVRWNHPVHGLLLPESFINVAESINLAGELGRWVMRMACAEFGRWRSRGIGLDGRLRINVSPVQLVAEGFAEMVAQTLTDYDLPGESICLEITESVVVQDIEMTRSTLTALKGVGVQIAIDDFGTGYSVLTHLKSLPVDSLKIDRGFVHDLGHSAGDLAIVRAIIALADAFGLGLCAEGVETDIAAQTLLRHGCYRAQGFLLSPPLTGSEMAELFAQHKISLPFGSSSSAIS